MGGSRDRGDVAGVPGWVLECKATRELDLARAMNEAKLEAGNAGVGDYAAVLKRRNHRVEDAYAVMPLRSLVRLLNRIGAGTATTETVSDERIDADHAQGLLAGRWRHPG